MAAQGEELRPRPPTGPRPRGKKEKEKDADGSPRTKDRERRGSRAEGGTAGVAGEPSKKQGRSSHRKSKERITENWRHHFHQFLASSNGEAFTQASRGALHLQFSPLSSDDVDLIAAVRSLPESRPCCKLLGGSYLT